MPHTAGNIKRGGDITSFLSLIFIKTRSITKGTSTNSIILIKLSISILSADLPYQIACEKGRADNTQIQKLTNSIMVMPTVRLILSLLTFVIRSLLKIVI
jgi:hypothetical protein